MPALNTDRSSNEVDSDWSLSIFYPEEVKIITQSKDVDVHSLIGNIGGYLGLFLGTSFNFYKSTFYYSVLDQKIDNRNLG